MRSIISGFIGILGLSSLAIASEPSDLARSKTSQWLWNKAHQSNLKGDESFKGEALIYMKDQADLSGSRVLSTKEEKGRFVHAALVKTAEASQKDLRAWLSEQKIAFEAHWVVNMIAVKNATTAQLEDIAERSDVMRVMGNPSIKNVAPELKNSLFDLKSAKGIEAGVARISADKVWSEFNVRGEGIVVAGQDTGVEWDHPALKSHYRGWDGSNANHDYNWFDAIKTEIGGGSSCKYDSAVPCDDHDHGTHTVGTMVGDDGKGNQVGVAPGAKWIACRNMDNGLGRPSTYISCFEWFLAPWKRGEDSFKSGDPTKSPHVINNSWGCPKSEGCEGGEFELVLQSLEAAGIFVVVSAGNDGPSCSTIKDGPAFNTDYVLSVGAMDAKSNKIASFSSRGPSTFDNKIGPHITAPGVSVRSAVRGGRYSGSIWSGTSMAGPHVAGQVALLWSAQPNLIGDIAKTREVIMNTADNMTQASQTCGGVAGTAIPNNTWGFGVVNALKAVKAVR